MNSKIMAIFDYANPKNHWINYYFFLNSYQHAKEQFIPSVHPSDTVNFRFLSPDSPHPIFYHAHPKDFQLLFNLCENVPSCKKSVCSRDIVNFRVHKADLSNPFQKMSNQKIFDQLLIFVNLYQHAKNEAVSLICSGEIADLKIL